MCKRIPPLKILFLSSALTLFILACSLILVMQLPRIGIELSIDDSDGIYVSHIYQESPASSSALMVGDVIIGISNNNIHFIPVRRQIIVQDPDIFPDFYQFNQFIQSMHELDTIFRSNFTYIKKQSGDVIVIKKAITNQIFWLPNWYWWMVILGSCVFMIAATIFGYNPKNRSALFLFISGVGLWGASIFYASYGAREIAPFNPDYLTLFISLKHLSLCVFVWGGISLLWQYPIEQKFGWPYRICTIAFFGAWFLNTFQIQELPFHTYYLIPYLLPTLVGLYATHRQYVISRPSPINRAIMLWFSSSIWASILTIYIFQILPTLTTGYPTSNLVVQFMIFFLYIGFAFGVTKFRLFDIDQWWFNTWVVFFLAICILAIDTLVVFIWNASEQSAFSIALLVSFWVYFPIREKLWKLIFQRKRNYLINDYLAEIISLFSALDRSPIDTNKYKKVFSFIFKPSACDNFLDENIGIKGPKLQNNGLNLTIPLGNSEYLTLTGKNSGNHLFNNRDEVFSQSVLELINKIITLNQSAKRAEETERSRIMRDLHDDVGSKLLDLIHGTKDPRAKTIAKETLNSLRLSVIPLHNNMPKCLNDTIHEWCDEMQLRLSDASIEFRSSIEIKQSDSLHIRGYINITRILREMTSNLLKHSKTSSVFIKFSTKCHLLNIEFNQIGNESDPNDFRDGTGLNNIASRTQEISGEITANSTNNKNTQSLRYSIHIPILR